MEWTCSERGFISSREWNLETCSFIFHLSHIHEIMHELKSKIYILAKNWTVEFFLLPRSPQSLLINSLIKFEILDFQTLPGAFA